MKVYLDNAATSPIHPYVLEAIIPYLKEDFGNPSSIHSFGRKVRVAIEDAREKVAEFINADASEVYFVSSGTEANNFPIFGIAKTQFLESGKNKIISSPAEHHCVLDALEQLEKEGFTKELVKVKNDASIDFQKLQYLINEKTSLITLMHVNNETGSINDIGNISSITKNENVYFHTDAVQSFGKMKIDVKRLGVDSLSVSGHKIGAPKGVGAVYVKSGTPLSPMLFGGSQERNRRGGTENVSGIVGLAKAIEIASKQIDQNFEHIANLKKYFLEGIGNISKDSLIINSTSNGIPHIVSLTFNSQYFNNDSESMLMYLDINGIAASNGAACTSGTLNPSHVILAAGKNINDANGTIRFSFGPQNTLAELEYTLEVIKNMADKFSK